MLIGQLKFKVYNYYLGVKMALGRDGTKFIKKNIFQNRDERNEHDILKVFLFIVVGLQNHKILTKFII